MHSEVLIPINSRRMMDALIEKLGQLNGLLVESSITLLYVQTLVYDTTLGLEAVVVAPGVEGKGWSILDQACQALKAKGLSCKAVLKTGEPVQEICDYAAEERMDLIVVCRREQGPFENLLFADTSEELVERAPAHVLVLK